MMPTNATDWNPEAYARFRGLRLRPVLDLLMQVGELAGGDVIDLGCGDGAAAASLKMRFPKRDVIGVDASAAMLAQARGYTRTDLANIAIWTPTAAPALIFSNAALHWLADHATLLPRLISLLAPGGTLAVQMPRQQMALSHALLRDLAARMFPDRFGFTDWHPQVAEPATYAAMLAPHGALNLWETTYHQHIAAVTTGHPIRHFTASTAMRPITERLSADEQTTFITAYDSALDLAYPLASDASVLFPFQRLFFTLSRPE